MTSLFSASACKDLVTDLADACHQFEATTQELMAIAHKTAQDRGVNADTLVAFGMLAQIALADSPQPFEGLNLWSPGDGEAFVAAVAQHLGIDTDSEPHTTTEVPGPEEDHGL